MNDIATGFVSDVLYCQDPKISHHIFHAFREMSEKDVRNVHHSYVKGGLALHVQLSELVHDISSSSSTISELLRLTSKYAKASDFDSVVMIRASTRDRFDEEVDRVATSWMNQMKQTSVQLEKSIFKNPNMQSTLSAYFTAKKDQILELLGIDCNKNDYVIDARFHKHPNLDIVSASNSNKITCCLRSTEQNFLFVSRNKTIRFVDDGGATRAFWLLRIKCCIRVSVVSRFDPSIVIASKNVLGEVLDVSIPLFDDSGRIRFFAQNHQYHIRKFSPVICGMKMPEVPCANLEYCLDDLKISMFDFAIPAKSVKRQMRYLLLRSVKSLVFRDKDEVDPSAIVHDPVAEFWNKAADLFGDMNKSSFILLGCYTAEYLFDYSILQNIQKKHALGHVHLNSRSRNAIFAAFS